jgi:hypothetical protein
VPRTGQAGGLNLYGSRMGALPLDPTLIVRVGFMEPAGEKNAGHPVDPNDAQ